MRHTIRIDLKGNKPAEAMDCVWDSWSFNIQALGRDNTQAEKNLREALETTLNKFRELYGDEAIMSLLDRTSLSPPRGVSDAHLQSEGTSQ